MRFVAENAPYDIAGYVRILRADDIRHVDRQHGDAARERARQQLPVIKRDYLLIPRIIEAADTVQLVGERRSRKPLRLIYDTLIDAVRYQYAETIHPREKQIALKSLRKSIG